MKQEPTVSIIMPVFNAAVHLRSSIGCVRAQTFHDWELVAVDDGSTDGSWATLAQIALEEPQVRPFRQANAGAATARNRALAEARGAYIAFLDADDTWHPDFLTAMLSALDGKPPHTIAYCGWQNLGLGAGRDQPYVPPDYECDGKTEALLAACPWPIHAALVPAELIRDAGGFDPGLTSCMDYDLWLRIGNAYPLQRVPQVLAYYHHHGGEHITSDKARIALNHRRAQQKFITSNPDVRRQVGSRRLRQLTEGLLLHRGYESYWKRDLPAARRIFRAVMKRAYGTPRDWKYMLPSLLPLAAHRWLVERLATSDEAAQ
jgi:GT2 family glycosyltransferase